MSTIARKLPGAARVTAIVGLSVTIAALVGTAVAAQDEPSPTASTRSTERLTRGATVFSRTCTSCHQVGGVGVPGQFPPLRGNDRARDAAYVERTIREGKQGPLTVNGVDYNGVMPTVGNSLSDDDIRAIAAYVAADLKLPAGARAIAPPIPLSPGPPTLSVLFALLGYAIAGGVGVVVVAPVVVGKTDRVHLPWMHAAAKAGVIVGYFAMALVVVPGFVLASEQVSALPTTVQTLIGMGLWGGGLVIGIGALIWAHRTDRI